MPRPPPSLLLSILGEEGCGSRFMHDIKVHTVTSKFLEKHIIIIIMHTHSQAFVRKCLIEVE